MGSLRAGTWWLLRILPKGRMRAEALVVAADSAERGVCAQGREEVPRAYALPSTHLIYSARKRGHLMKAVP